MQQGPPDEQIAAYEAAIATLETTLAGNSNSALVKQLRHELGGDQVLELTAIALLQKKARHKLGPGIWWATDRALQQATPWQVAKLKASWFGEQLVYDLCCGIGGDAIQLAKRPGQPQGVIAVDIDPVIIAYAAANLRHACSETQFDCEVAETRCQDVLQLEIPAHAAIHLDPDRRIGGKRTTRPEDYQPQLSEVMPRIKAAPAAIIKLAPAAKLDLDPDLGEHAHRCWISLAGSVREQSLLLGDALTRAGMISGSLSAIAVNNRGSVARFDLGDYPVAKLDSLRVASVASPGRWIVDPDAAIRAAGLTEAFAMEHGLKTLGGPTGFLTSEGDLDSETLEKVRLIATVGEVIWSGSCDERKIRRELRRRNSHAERIKVRGSGHDPAVLSKRFRECGETPIGLWIGRAGRGVFAAFSD